MEHVETSHKIISRLKDGQLETMVLKYCAPHFSINKTKEVPKDEPIDIPKIKLAKKTKTKEVPKDDIPKIKLAKKAKIIIIKPKK